MGHEKIHYSTFEKNSLMKRDTFDYKPFHTSPHQPNKIYLLFLNKNLQMKPYTSDFKPFHNFSYQSPKIYLHFQNKTKIFNET